ncbi:2-oxoglutarate dehydrogenase [Trinickia violacea]|uniref:2-oxoglutarate dehydrogenase n=1 Tax=Trinickia violacea TaxID=2571746 RepID=A0A4P8IUE2_9BURK|nr:2-oxoglutarate dehydrogenase [Trinickia violacea]QCP52722.1 2-oxoglutarate dehydrogenase [Trinickia violacea]
MSLIDMLRRLLPLIVLGAVVGNAQAATTQAVAPVTLPKGGHGVDGPFFPTNRPAPVTPSTGAQLQQQAQQRLEARLGANTVLNNGASITKEQAQSNGLGYIAKHFDQIDTAHSGRVSMDSVRQYLQQQH